MDPPMLPKYGVYIGQAYIPLELSSRPDDCVALKTDKSAVNKTIQVEALGPESKRDFDLDDIEDEDSVVQLNLSWKVFSNHGKKDVAKLVDSYDADSLGELDASPVTNEDEYDVDYSDDEDAGSGNESEDPDQDSSSFSQTVYNAGEDEEDEDEPATFTYFTIRSESAHGLRFKIKLKHYVSTESPGSKFRLRFKSFKLYVPIDQAEHVLGGENISSLVHMNWARNIAEEAVDLIASELMETGDEQLIGAPLKGARRTVKKKAKKAVKATKSAYRSGKKTAKRGVRRVKRTTRRAKKAVTRRARSVRKKFTARIPKGAKKKFNSLRGKSPSRRQPKAPSSRQTRRLERASGKMAAGQKLTRRERKTVKKFANQNQRQLGKMNAPNKPLPAPPGKAGGAPSPPGSPRPNKPLPPVPGSKGAAAPPSTPAPKPQASASASPPQQQQKQPKEKKQPKEPKQQKQPKEKKQSDGSSSGGQSKAQSDSSPSGSSGGGAASPSPDVQPQQTVGDDNSNELNAAALGFAGGAAVGAVGTAAMTPTPYYGGYQPVPAPQQAYPPPQQPPVGRYPPPQAQPGGPQSQQGAPDQDFDQDLQSGAGQQQFPQQQVSGGSGGDQSDSSPQSSPRRQVEEFKIAPKLVPAKEESGNESPFEEETPISDLIGENMMVASRELTPRERILKGVIDVYTEKNGLPPREDAIRELDEKLKKPAVLSLHVAIEIVVDWLMDLLSPRVPPASPEEMRNPPPAM